MVELSALNPDDPTGQPITVRLPDEIVSLVCPDCEGLVGGGDPKYVRVGYAIQRPCPFCGKGPPVVIDCAIGHQE